jgi:pSer/pThr/pTyr-binding forkhead associated (FHA) protein
VSLRVDVVGTMRAQGEPHPFDGPRTRLFEGTLLLGRLPSRMPALTLDSPRVDPEHALIYVSTSDGLWHIKDLGSARGTWLLPGPSRTEDIALSGTQVLTLGDTVIRVSVLPDG